MRRAGYACARWPRSPMASRRAAAVLVRSRQEARRDTAAVLTQWLATERLASRGSAATNGVRLLEEGLSQTAWTASLRAGRLDRATSGRAFPPRPTRTSSSTSTPAPSSSAAPAHPPYVAAQQAPARPRRATWSASCGAARRSSTTSWWSSPGARGPPVSPDASAGRARRPGGRDPARAPRPCPGRASDLR